MPFFLHFPEFLIYLLLLFASECGAQSRTTTDPNDWAFIANTFGKRTTTTPGLHPDLAESSPVPVQSPPPQTVSSPPGFSYFFHESSTPLPTRLATSSPSPLTLKTTESVSGELGNLVTLVGDDHETNQTATNPIRLFNITTTLPLCGYTSEMESGRAPYTVEEANLLISNFSKDSFGIIRNATVQEESPWIAVLTSYHDFIPLHCYGVIIDESHILSTKSCISILTSFQGQVIEVQLGLFIGHEASPNDTSVKSYQVDVSTDVLTDPSSNLTLITLNETITFKSPLIRPICIAPTRAKCHSACKGGFFSVATGVPGSRLYLTQSQPVRALMLLPNETTDGFEIINNSTDNLPGLFDGALLGTMRMGRLHLCGFMDLPQRYIPICDFYDWLIGPEPLEQVTEPEPVDEWEFDGAITESVTLATTQNSSVILAAGPPSTMLFSWRETLLPILLINTLLSCLIFL